MMEVKGRQMRENGDVKVEDGEKRKGGSWGLGEWWWWGGGLIDNESMRQLYSAAATG